jgi:hypothetical protein
MYAFANNKKEKTGAILTPVFTRVVNNYSFESW